MRVLITSARFPHALAEVRRFGLEGHAVYAADTFWAAPGLHSRHVSEAVRVAPAAFETDRFIDDIARAIERHAIDLVVPACEEGFFLAAHRDRLPKRAELFAPSFATMARLHDKATFVDLAASLGLRVPRTVVARSRDELREATLQFDSYLARAAFSRGGTKLYTNTGPLAGRVKLADCDPTPERPWICQQFLRGTEVCSFSVARHGRVGAHCTYEHPKSIEHAGGISYISIDEPEAVDVARRICESLEYHGQISFDFMRTAEGLYLLECNPRPTAGVCMMPAADFVGAALGTRMDTTVAVTPPGVREHSAVALVRDMFKDPSAILSDLDELISGGQDVYWQRDDRLPGLFQMLTYPRLIAYRRFLKRGMPRSTDLIDAQFFDIAWDGRPLQPAQRATG